MGDAISISELSWGGASHRDYAINFIEGIVQFTGFQEIGFTFWEEFAASNLGKK